MKEKEEIEEDETTPLKSSNINDLLEPLVNEEKPRIKKRLFESVNIPLNDYTNKNKNEYNFNSSDLKKEKEKEDKIKKIRNELNELDNNTEDSSNYSNIPPIETLKCQNFIFIIILTILSSLQFGIFIFIFNLFQKNNNMNQTINNFTQNKFYLLFLVLSWKYQIYFICYLFYALFLFFKNNIQYNSNDSISSIKNDSTNLFEINPTYNFRKFKYRYLMKYGSSYTSYFNIFIFTSNIFNYPKENNFFENFLNLDEILKGISGLIFSVILFEGSYFYYFGIIYLFQSITAMLPYYIQFKFNDKNRNNKKEKIKNFKYIFPIIISIGFYFLLKSITYNGINYYLYLLLILFICLLSQIYSQKKFIQKSHDESPFHILFRTYFILFLISNSVALIIELIYNKYNIRNLFFWLTDIYIFLSCFIGFGILGCFYNILLTFMRISLSNNVIVKLIKYFNLAIIDLLGIYIFKQYNIFNKADYFMGITLCGISLFMLDFCDLL